MVLRETPQASANWACVKVEPSDIHEATGCVMDYRKSLDLGQPMKLERASRLLLLRLRQGVGHKISQLLVLVYPVSTHGKKLLWVAGCDVVGYFWRGGDIFYKTLQ